MRKLSCVGAAVLTFAISAILLVDPWATRYRFHKAALKGDLATIDRMLGEGTPVDLRDDFTETALMDAAEEGHLVVVKRLLSAGADVNAQTDGGATPLMRAAESGQLDIVEALLAAGADVNHKSMGDQTALMGAAAGGPGCRRGRPRAQGSRHRWRRGHR